MLEDHRHSTQNDAAARGLYPEPPTKPSFGRIVIHLFSQNVTAVLPGTRGATRGSCTRRAAGGG